MFYGYFHNFPFPFHLQVDFSYMHQFKPGTYLKRISLLNSDHIKFPPKGQITAFASSVHAVFTFIIYLHFQCCNCFSFIGNKEVFFLFPVVLIPTINEIFKIFIIFFFFNYTKKNTFVLMEHPNRLFNSKHPELSCFMEIFFIIWIDNN